MELIHTRVLSSFVLLHCPAFGNEGKKEKKRELDAAASSLPLRRCRDRLPSPCRGTARIGKSCCVRGIAVGSGCAASATYKRDMESLPREITFDRCFSHRRGSPCASTYRLGNARVWRCVGWLGVAQNGRSSPPPLRRSSDDDNYRRKEENNARTKALLLETLQRPKPEEKNELMVLGGYDILTRFLDERIQAERAESLNRRLWICREGSAACDAWHVVSLLFCFLARCLWNHVQVLRNDRGAP